MGLALLFLFNIFLVMDANSPLFLVSVIEFMIIALNMTEVATRGFEDFVLSTMEKFVSRFLYRVIT